MSEDEQRFVKTRLRPSGVMFNTYFRDLSRVVHTQWQESTDPYGKPAILFKHEGGAEAIAGELYKMLSADFARNLNVELYNSNSETRKVEIKEPTTTVNPLLSVYEALETPKQKPQQATTRRRTTKQSQPSQRSLFDLMPVPDSKPNQQNQFH